MICGQPAETIGKFGRELETRGKSFEPAGNYRRDTGKFFMWRSKNSIIAFKTDSGRCMNKACPSRGNLMCSALRKSRLARTTSESVKRASSSGFPCRRSTGQGICGRTFSAFQSSYVLASNAMLRTSGSVDSLCLPLLQVFQKRRVRRCPAVEAGFFQCRERSVPAIRRRPTSSSTARTASGKFRRRDSQERTWNRRQSQPTVETRRQPTERRSRPANVQKWPARQERGCV